MPGLAFQNPGLVNERKFVGDARDLPFVLALLDARLLPDARTSARAPCA